MRQANPAALGPQLVICSSQISKLVKIVTIFVRYAYDDEFKSISLNAIGNGQFVCLRESSSQNGSMSTPSLKKKGA